jgi:probable F420-dependent oxidoreductase
MRLDTGFLSFDLRDIPDYARKAESLGFGALWAAETKHDPFLPLAVAATATSRLGLGTAIAIAFARKWEAPGPRLRDLVGALRAIWDTWQNKAPLDFQGKSYRINLMTPFFDPGPIEHPRIPVYLAGVNPYMARLAGEIADGLHIHSFHSAKYLRDVLHPAVSEGLKISNRSRLDFGFRASTMVVIGDSRAEIEEQKQQVKQQIAFYASTRTYAAVLAAHGLEDLSPRLHAKSLEGDWKGMASLISDAMLEDFAVIGSWSEIGARIRERFAGLYDRTQLYPSFAPSLDDPRMQRLAREFNG